MIPMLGSSDITNLNSFFSSVVVTSVLSESNSFQGQDQDEMMTS